MNNLTYTINIGNKAQNQIQNWQISPTSLRVSERYSNIETIVDFNPINIVEISHSLSSPLIDSTKSSEKTNTQYPDRIALPTAEGIYLVEVSKVIRLEADKNYTMVHIEGQKPILISKTLKETEKQLDPNTFFRIHQSHTVDIHKIDIYHRGRGGSVTLCNGEILPVSKNKKEELLNVLFPST